MSVITPNETSRSWHKAKRKSSVQLYLSGVEGDSAELVGGPRSRLFRHLSILPITDWINPEEIWRGGRGGGPGRS